MPLNYAVLSDGNCIIITDTTSATNIETIPKEKVVLQIVLAGEAQNKSGVDELWIQHDGRYSTEIPYTEVDVANAGVAPVSVEAFRVATLGLLNVNTSFPIPMAILSITQAGGADPTAAVLFNTTGSTFTYARSATGAYTVTPSGTWVDGKSIILFGSTFPGGVLANLNFVSCRFNAGGSLFVIETGTISTAPDDGILTDAIFIIMKLN